MTNLVPIGRALISVSDKTGLLDLARALACAQQLEPEVSSLRVSGPESFRGLLAGSSVVTDLFSYAFGPAFHALLRTLPTDDHADVTDPP